MIGLIHNFTKSVLVYLSLHNLSNTDYFFAERN